MSKSTWTEDNSAYLSAALDWLRSRLQSSAREEDPMAKRAKKAGAAKNTGTSDPASEKMKQLAESMDSPPALDALAAALEMSAFERDVLLLSAAPEFDGSIGLLYREAYLKLGLNPNHDAPSFALAMALFDQAAWDSLSPLRPLRYWHLLEIDQRGPQPLLLSALRVDERIVDFLRGLNRFDERLEQYVHPVSTVDDDGLSESQEKTAGLIARQFDPGRRQESTRVLQLLGPHHGTKLLVACNAARALNRQLCTMHPEALPAQVAEIELLCRLWQRENRLLSLMVLIEHSSGNSAERRDAAAQHFIARAGGCILMDVREGAAASREVRSFEIEKPTRAEQLAAWLKALGKAEEDLARSLASQFTLDLPDIRAVAGEFKDSKGKREELWDACRAQVRPQMEMLALPIKPRARWDQLVVPEQERLLLTQIAAQVRARSRVYEDWGFSSRMNRGLGITALFVGESGTGKTMAAEVIANELRLFLYRIDLSSIVSKYIGETEKNLSRLFDAAEDGGAILFFDEADALFGKRSEVKDSHDRYANIETNYLLQRMEAYSGLAILATNMRSAMDTAFTRRLRFIVNFPFPGVSDRERMWAAMFPEETPTHALDFRKLARFNLTGGSISNAAVNAAFLAANAGEPICMNSILAAIRQEMIKLDRPINENDFVWAPAVVERDRKTKHKEDVA